MGEVTDQLEIEVESGDDSDDGNPPATGGTTP
jgi:hypothetical protein